MWAVLKDKTLKKLTSSCTENASCQGPEHAHIGLIKSVAHLKDVFLCFLLYHCRSGLVRVQQYEQMLEDMVDGNDCDSRPLQVDQDKIQVALSGDRNFSIACELGVRYPTLRAMLNREDLHLHISVSFCSYFINNINVFVFYEIYRVGTCLSCPVHIYETCII